MKRAAQVPLKKPYQAPKLIVYGDLTQLTMARAMIGGMLDGNMAKRT
jgi:hypothetical protein